MQIMDMYSKMFRPRRNSLPSSNLHRSKTKVLPKTEYNPPKNSKVVHESKKLRSKTPACVKQLNYNESYTSNIRNYPEHSFSDGDEIPNNKTNFYKVYERNEMVKDKRPHLISSQPIDIPSKRLPDMAFQHTPPPYDPSQNFGTCKKFKDNDIEQLLVEKYALLKQLMNIDERCSSPNGDNFYAGAKFNNSPSPGDLPFPPMQWINTCQAEAKTIQKLPLLLNITI